MSERSTTRWEQFWFRPVGTVGLRIVRLVVFGVAGMVLFTDIGVLVPSIGNAGALWDPISFYRFVPAPAAAFLDVAFPLAVAGCIAGAAGLGGRRVALPVGLLAGFLVGIGNNLGKVNHDRNVLVMALFVLAFAPAAERGAEPSWRFRWPVAAVALGYALMFFFAGISKVRASGVDWVLSENMRNILISENLLLRAPALSDVALWIAAEPWRWKTAAALALVGELGLVIGVVTRHPIASAVLVAQGAGVIFGLNLLLDLGGWPLVVMAAVLVDWNELVRLRAPWPTVVGAGIFTIIAGITVLIRPASLVVRETALVAVMGCIATIALHRSSTPARPETIDMPV